MVTVGTENLLEVEELLMLNVPSDCKALELLLSHMMEGVGKPSAEHVSSTVSMAMAIVMFAGASVTTGFSGKGMGGRKNIQYRIVKCKVICIHYKLFFLSDDKIIYASPI